MSVAARAGLRRSSSNAGTKSIVSAQAAFLNSQARALLGDRARIFECKYEDYNTTEKYDAVLFCESFQYVKVYEAFDKIMAQLRPGGQLIICDFFRTADDDRSSISGGHRLPHFREALSHHPFTQVEEIDITDRTAPTFTVIDSAFTQVLQPIWNEVDEAALATHPWLFKMRHMVLSPQARQGEMQILHSPAQRRELQKVQNVSADALRTQLSFFGK